MPLLQSSLYPGNLGPLSRETFHQTLESTETWFKLKLMLLQRDIQGSSGSAFFTNVRRLRRMHDYMYWMTADKPLNRARFHSGNRFCLPTVKMLRHALDWRRKKKTQFFPEKKFLSGKIRLVTTPRSSVSNKQPAGPGKWLIG